MITLRTGRADEAEAIAEVHRAAFGPGHGPDVAELAARIMASGLMPADWSIVAVDGGGALVGSVLVSYCDLVRADGSRRPVPVLSPVGVLPERHKEGIGAALVRESLRRVEEAGEPVLIVEGDWNYYGRFGFEPAEDHGIERPRPDIPRSAFQVARLPAYAADLAGKVVYAPAFDVATG